MPDEIVDNAENASVESAEEHQESQIDFEAEASKMGWRPEDKFKGDKSRWVDAKTFYERGQEVLPIVKQELRKTREELAEVRKAAQEFYKLTEEAAARKEKEWQGKYEQAIRDKADAINKGDGEAAVEAEARQKELEADRPAPPKKEAPKPHPAFAAWQSQNEWFGKDKAKTRIAEGIGLELMRQGIQGDEFFRKLDEELSESYTPPAPRQGAQRGGRPSGESKGARTYDNLKPEFKEACDRMVRNLNIKREQYLAGCDNDAFRS